MRILIFGDSITYGVFDSKGGWATRLVSDYLMEQQANPGKDVPFAYNLGFSGDTTKHMTQRLPAETEARFSLWSNDKNITFVLAIGINDTQVRGEPVSSPEQYAKELAELYNTASRYSNKILFVGLTPSIHKPWADEFYNPDRIWLFEQAQRAFVEKHDLPFVPLFEAFTDGLSKGEQLIDDDGLHPNDAGHQLIYDLVKPKLKALIKGT